MIITVWVLCAWTALSVAKPVMYGPPVSISAQSVHRLGHEQGQAAKTR
jgi:hypothetical protein